MKNFKTLFLAAFVIFSGIILTGCEKPSMEADLQEMEAQETEDAITTLEMESETLLNDESLLDSDLEELGNIDFEESETIIQNLESEADLLLQEESLLDAELTDLESLDF